MIQTIRFTSNRWELREEFFLIPVNFIVVLFHLDYEIFYMNFELLYIYLEANLKYNLSK